MEIGGERRDGKGVFVGTQEDNMNKEGLSNEYCWMIFFYMYKELESGAWVTQKVYLLQIWLRSTDNQSIKNNSMSKDAFFFLSDE